MSDKHGIEETMDLVAFAEKVVESLIAHKADDGKIDGGEIASTLVTSTPAAIAAMVGAGKIDDELKDLSDEEKDKLIAAAMPVLLKMVGMFVKVDGATA